MKVRFLRSVKMMAIAAGLFSALHVQAFEVGENVTSFTDNETMKLGVPYTLQGGSREYLRYKLVTFELDAPAAGTYAVEYLVRTTGNNVQLAAIASDSEYEFDTPDYSLFAHALQATDADLIIPVDSEEGDAGEETETVEPAPEPGTPIYMYSPVELKAGKNYVHVFMHIFWRNDNVAPQKVQFEGIKVLGQGSGEVAEVAAQASQKAYMVKFYGGMKDDTTAKMISDYEALLKAIQADYTKADLSAVKADIALTEAKEQEVRHGKGVIVSDDSTRLEVLLYHSEWDSKGNIIAEPQNGVYEMQNGEDEWPTQIEFTQTYSFSYKFTAGKSGNWFPQFYASSNNAATIDITILAEDSSTVVMPKYSLSTSNGAWQNYELMDKRDVCKFKMEEGKTYYMNLYYNQYTNVKGILIRNIPDQTYTSAELEALLDEAQEVMAKFADPAVRATLEDQSLYDALDEVVGEGYASIGSPDDVITPIYQNIKDAIVALQNANLLNSFPNNEANPFDVTRMSSVSNCSYKATDGIMQLDNFRANGYAEYKVYNTIDAEFEVNFEYANTGNNCTMEFIVTVERDGELFEVAHGTNEEPFESTGSWTTWEPKRVKVGPVPEGHVFVKITGSGASYVGNPRLFFFTPIAGTEGAGAKALEVAMADFIAKYTPENLRALIATAQEEMAKYPATEYDQTQVLAVDSIVGVANAALEGDNLSGRAKAYNALETAISDLTKSVKLFTAEQLQALIMKAEEETIKYPESEYDQTQVNTVNALVTRGQTAIEEGDHLAISSIYSSLEAAIVKLADSKTYTWTDVPTESIDLNTGSFTGNWRVEGGGNIGYAYEGGSATFHLNIIEASGYDLNIAAGNPGDGAQMRITFLSADDSEIFSQVVDVPNTGNWGSADNFTIELKNITLPAGKVKMVIYGEKKGGNGWVGNTHAISLVKNDPTGIDTINANAATQGIYTLQGMRVGKTSKGLYIINGKKVVVR